MLKYYIQKYIQYIQYNAFFQTKNIAKTKNAIKKTKKTKPKKNTTAKKCSYLDKCITDNENVSIRYLNSLQKNADNANEIKRMQKLITFSKYKNDIKKNVKIHFVILNVKILYLKKD